MIAYDAAAMSRAVGTDETLDLRRAGRAIARRRRLVLWLLALGTGMGILYVVLRPPVYVATARVLLASTNADANGRPLLDVHNEVYVATSSEVLKRVGGVVRPSLTAEQLRRRIAVDSPSDGVLELLASAPSAPEAKLLADAVVNAYLAVSNSPKASETSIAALKAQAAAISDQIERLKTQIANEQYSLFGVDPNSGEGLRRAALIDALGSAEVEDERTLNNINTRIGDALFNAQLRSQGARVLDPAVEPRQSDAPRPLRDIGVGATLGLVAGVLAAVVLDHRDRHRELRDGGVQVVGVPVLGSLELPRTAPATPDHDEVTTSRPAMLTTEDHPCADLYDGPSHGRRLAGSSGQ